MGPVKFVADLWCDLSKPVQEGHFFNGKRFGSIGLTSLEKNPKNCPILRENGKSGFRVILGSFLDFTQNW